MAGRRLLVLLVAVSVGHILLISAQVQSRRGLPIVQEAAFGVFASVQRASSAVADAGVGVWRYYVALSGVARENERLRAQLLQFEGELQQERAAAGRLRSLEEALALQRTAAQPLLAARVTAGSASPGALTVTIDRGSDDGVEVDMGVVGARGVVGRVIGPVSGRAALVQLLVARSAAAAVYFERSGAGAMAVGGAADGLLRAEFVPLLADIQAGERVMTSGLDGLYPSGFLVGTVERVSTLGTERQVVIRPAADFSRVDLVLVVLSRHPRGEGGS